MKFSMTGQEKCDLLIQVLLNRGDLMGMFDDIYIKSNHVDIHVRYPSELLQQT